MNLDKQVLIKEGENIVAIIGLDGKVMSKDRKLKLYIEVLLESPNFMDAEKLPSNYVLIRDHLAGELREDGYTIG